jgi:hypothetical protein
MGNDAFPSLQFQIAPNDLRAVTGVSVHVPDRGAETVSGTSNLLPFAAVMLRIRIEALRQSHAQLIAVRETHFESSPKIFNKGWHFLHNAMRPDPEIEAGKVLQLLSGSLKARREHRLKIVTLDLLSFPATNLSFEIVDRSGNHHIPRSEAELLKLFEFLTGRLAGANLVAGISPELPRVQVFNFGNKPTGTAVVQSFPDGLPPEYVTCELTNVDYTVPEEIDALIDRAHAVLRTDVSSIRKVADHAMLAPTRLDLSIGELDGSFPQIVLTLANSTYRHYAAFAFAEFLANYDAEFQPLLDFTRHVPDSFQPSPATCSIGVRVLVETSDNTIIVAYRSDQVKLNPDVWSVSANEGVRRRLLKGGQTGSDLLTLAVYQAIQNELRIQVDQCHPPVLLSIYRNSYNQWGAGFAVKTELSSADVIARQKKAVHNFEYRKLAALPLDLTACGETMRNLGERWYGGALETICQFFSWRFLERFLDAIDIGAALSLAAGDAIIPIDQPNPAMLPSKP